jgi:Ca2+/H+ antiporter, TMEM165/GDT1 family
MNLEKVVFGFFIILAMTLNFGFVYGDLENPAHHHVYELFFAVIVNLIATVLKFGERTQIAAIHLASSLVPNLGLLAARGSGFQLSTSRAPA